MVWRTASGTARPTGERVARLYGVLRPHLDERQRRLLLGAEAIRLGRGGIKAVAGATEGVFQKSIFAGCGAEMILAWVAVT